jgi:hypothetical protein
MKTVDLDMLCILSWQLGKGWWSFSLRQSQAARQRHVQSRFAFEANGCSVTENTHTQLRVHNRRDAGLTLTLRQPRECGSRHSKRNPAMLSTTALAVTACEMDRPWFFSWWPQITRLTVQIDAEPLSGTEC